MNKNTVSNGLVVGFLAAALACSALGASSAEAANPMGGGVVSTSGPGSQPTNTNTNANNGNTAGNQNAGQPVVIHAGGNVPRPGAGVVAPRLNAGQLMALKTSGKPHVMPHLVPSQIFAIGMAEGVEVAPGIVAQLNANAPELFAVGSDGMATAQFNPHRGPGAPQDTVALMLLPENATQDYALIFDVSSGFYNVSVDAFTVDPAGRLSDVLLSNSVVRTNSLNQIVVNYEHTLTPTTGIYVVLSSSSAWSFTRATGFRH